MIHKDWFGWKYTRHGVCNTSQKTVILKALSLKNKTEFIKKTKYLKDVKGCLQCDKSRGKNAGKHLRGEN